MKRKVYMSLVILIFVVSFFGVCYAKNSESAVAAVFISSQGERLTARFDTGSKMVTLELSDGTIITLPVAVSASGSRYSDGKTTFWEHQGGVTLYSGEMLLFEGKEYSAPNSDHPGPGNLNRLQN